MSKPIHIMVDCETMSLAPNAAIVQIGAVVMNGSDLPFTPLNVHIDPEQLSGLVYHKDPATMMWWDQQDPEVRNQVFSGTTSPYSAATQFIEWINKLGDPADVYLWADHVNADIVWLQHLVEQELGEWPFNFRQVVDYATLKILLPNVEKPNMLTREHDALEDAYYQARHAEIMINYLKLKAPEINNVLLSIS